ncbi:reverse transcriptase domain-containing protein [Tanacetum coccineum]
MAFLTTTIASRYTQTNNQLMTSSNPRNQSTIQDGRGRATGAGFIKNTGNATANQSKVIRCYNCKGEGHITKQCNKSKRTYNSEWFKEKMLLAQDQEARVTLDEEQLAFLANTRERVDSGTYARALTTISILQTCDIDVF